MISLSCQRCRKTLLKTSSYSYSHANSSTDGEQQIMCHNCGWKQWFVDRRIAEATTHRVGFVMSGHSSP